MGQVKAVEYPEGEYGRRPDLNVILVAKDYHKKRAQSSTGENGAQSIAMSPKDDKRETLVHLHSQSVICDVDAGRQVAAGIRVPDVMRDMRQQCPPRLQPVNVAE